jgi:hypothetical protein
MTIAIIIILIIIAGAAYEHDRKRKSKARSQPTPVPAPVVQSIAGRYTGTLTPPTAPDGSMLAWGAPNDEHPPELTARVLSERPDWRGLGYCPGGTFEFVVAENGAITGAASVFGHHEPIVGAHTVTGGQVTMPLRSHWISLSFADGSVTGKLWEGHDELKRSMVSGLRA